MGSSHRYTPDSTATRVALWRAMHLIHDAKPPILNDPLGIKLIAPPEDWQNRPDMHAEGTKPFRASIVARARFVEDYVMQSYHAGIHQYVVLGSGIDTFAQRQLENVPHLQIFEVEKAETLAWKKMRLAEEGYPLPPQVHYVGFNFETTGHSWVKEIIKNGFDIKKPMVATSIGVSMYLSHEAIKKTLNDLKQFAIGSKFIMTFMLPLEDVDLQDRIGYERSLKGAQASGTPFISFFKPADMLNLARSVGFENLEHLSTVDIVDKYFKNRTDHLRPSTGEEFLIITV